MSAEQDEVDRFLDQFTDLQIAKSVLRRESRGEVPTDDWIVAWARKTVEAAR